MQIIGALPATVHNKSKERIEIFAEITSRQAQSSPRETCFSSTNKKVHFTLRPCKRRERFVRVVKNTRPPSVMPRF